MFWNLEQLLEKINDDVRVGRSQNPKRLELQRNLFFVVYFPHFSRASIAETWKITRESKNFLYFLYFLRASFRKMAETAKNHNSGYFS